MRKTRNLVPSGASVRIRPASSPFLSFCYDQRDPHLIIGNNIATSIVLGWGCRVIQAGQCRPMRWSIPQFSSLGTEC
ncbi:hypothetical protein VTI28DRAFT_5244 [Corynascus sepedonium]